MPLFATFAGVDAKLRRADEHMQTIENGIEGFTTSDPYDFITNYENASGDFVTKARQQLHPDMDWWSTVIGDCVHNLRSALDHLAHQLLALGGGTPKLGRGGTAFPIFDTDTGPNGGPRIPHITGAAGKVTGDVLAFVKGVQPYQRGNAFNLHPLWVLSELDNMDKHRKLALTSIAMTDFGLGIGEMSGVDLDIAHVGFQGPFNEQTELARWKARLTRPDGYVNVNTDGTIDVAFDAFTPCPDAPVLETLSDLRDYVQNVITVLRAKALRQAGF